MSLERERATAFVDGYGQTWESWDLAGFVDLFSDDVVYVEHPTDETVVGRDEMARYIRKEQSEQGAASVRMGKPIVEGDQVVAEFWATMTNRGGDTRWVLHRSARPDGRAMHPLSPVLVRI